MLGNLGRLALPQSSVAFDGQIDMNQLLMRDVLNVYTLQMSSDIRRQQPSTCNQAQPYLGYSPVGRAGHACHMRANANQASWTKSYGCCVTLANGLS